MHPGGARSAAWRWSKRPERIERLNLARPASLIAFPDRTIRVVAATLALAAGAVHLAQIGVHAEEGIEFAAFFLIVGLLQLGGAIALVALPSSSRALRLVALFGIAGSLLTVAVWAVDRSIGLPFGAERGEPETVGLADAAAGLFQLFTAFLLVVWALRPRALRRWLMAGGALALGLAAFWLLTRRAGVFDPDPRLTARPDLADATAVAFLLVLAVLCVGLAYARPTGRVALVALVALVILESALVAFTLPASAAPNRCGYGPLADGSRVSHAKAPPPIAIELGGVRSVATMIVVNCGDVAVTLTGIEPIAHGLTGDAGAITSIALDDAPANGRPGQTPVGHRRPVSGAELNPGQSVAVVLDVVGRADGVFSPSAFIIQYLYRGGADSIGFASYVWFCVGDAVCTPPTH